MIDEKLLEGMTFGELNEVLEYVLERIEKIQADRSEGKNDAVLDMLCVVANKIIMEMDAIMREQGRAYPEALAQWRKVMEGYEERFAKYTDFFLEEDTLLDLSENS